MIMNEVSVELRGQKWVLRTLSKYLMAVFGGIMGDSGEALGEAIARCAYRFLPYLLVSGPESMPTATGCELDGIKMLRVSPQWVAENIEPADAGVMFRTVLDASVLSETERKN